MSKTFAVLVEPAQYTLDRNRIVYKPLGIDFTYLNATSKASCEESRNQFPTGSILQQLKYINHIFKVYDTVIINGYDTKIFILFWLFNWFYEKRIGIESDTPLKIPRSCLKRFLKALYLRIIFFPRWVYGLAGGNFGHRRAFTHYGMPEKRVFLLPMVVDNEKFLRLSHSEINHDNFKFLYVGRLVQCKGLEDLLTAFECVHKQSPKTELYIVGAGEEADSLQKKWPANSWLHYCGQKFGEDLLNYYQKCHALILPSRFEPWGLVVNEALAAGLPVIVSDAVGAHYDLVDKKHTGIVYPVGEREALQDAMLEMIQKHEDYAKMSANARELMKNHWNLSYYRECLEHFLCTKK